MWSPAASVLGAGSTKRWVLTVRRSGLVSSTHMNMEDTCYNCVTAVRTSKDLRDEEEDARGRMAELERRLSRLALEEEHEREALRFAERSPTRLEAPTAEEC